MEAILERVSVVPEIATSFNETATKARELLGYAVAAHQSEDTRVLMELISIGCAPFTEKSVVDYKYMMERNANKWKRVPLQVMVSIGLVCGAIAFAFHSDPSGLVGIGFLFAAFVFCLVNNSSGWMHWQLRGLGGYGSPVPKAVLEKALLIQKHFTVDQSWTHPATKELIEQHTCAIGLCVSELGVDERVYDPFLVVRTESGKLYYVAVWDEPTFEDKVGV